MMKRNDDYQGLINALERRVRELEAQVCNLAIQVAALAARGVPSMPPTLPVVPFPPSPTWPFAPSAPMTPAVPLRYEITCDGTQKLQTPTAPDFTTLGDLSYGGTS
ncbi:MAG: hypothetical protein ACYCSN_18880 [Acidobacteriaceae bacterium]